MKTIRNLFVLLISINAYAQQATIIDPKSMSLPRYADLAAIQNAIGSPQSGFMVHNIQTSSNWLYDGAQWKNTADGVSQWISNAGNISFGNGNTFNNSLNTPIQNNIQINNTINVPISGTITDPGQVTIFISLNHTRAADLRIGITLPDNTFILLCENAGSIDDFVSTNTISFNHTSAFGIPFSGTSNGIVPPGIYRPSGFPPPNALAALNGKSINGNWQLSVLDMNNNIDIGTWFSWGITFGIPRKVGINTPNPSEALEVAGKIKMRQLQVTQDAAANKILTSDANGNATWKTNWVLNGSNLHFTSGNVGIGNNSPQAPLHFSNVVNKRKIMLSGVNNDHQFYGFGVNITGSGSELVYQSESTASSAHTFYSGMDGFNSKQLFQIKGNGQVSLGDGPNARIHFANQDYNRKIVLYEGTINSDHQFYGFGVNAGLLRYQVNSTANDHTFFAGSTTSTSNELFRIKGSGNVGIGQSTPQSKFEVNGALATTMIKVNSNITLDNSASVYYFQDGLDATLPNPAACPNRRYVLSNRSIKEVNILGYSPEALDGSSINFISPHTAIEIISDGTNWLQIK